jgi:hypothetical protein
MGALPNSCLYLPYTPCFFLDPIEEIYNSHSPLSIHLTKIIY